MRKEARALARSPEQGPDWKEFPLSIFDPKKASASHLRQALGKALRWLRSGDAGDGRLAREIAQEEIRGLGYIFYGRIAVLTILGLWVLRLPFDRSIAYLAVIFAFAVLSAVPYQLVRHGKTGKWIVALFVFLDAALLTYLLIVPPPFFVEGWTAQLNLRIPNFLLLVIFLTSMALSYSPSIVIWTGTVAAAAWSAGILWVVNLTDTKIQSSRTAMDIGASPERVIRDFLDPAMVNITNHQNQLVFLLIVTFILTVTVWRSRQLVRRQVAAESERANLSRYFSPNIVRELSEDRDALDQAEVRQVAILFADIVGFTSISERLSSEELIGLLREFHGRLAQTAFANDGTVDKYIGDSIMVHFGTPVTRDDDTVRALTCAAAMIGDIRHWNEERFARGDFPVEIGIGLHYGEVVVGNIGHEQRLEYAVLGDTVNVASRLERLTRRTRSTLIVSNALIEAVKSRGIDPQTIVPGLQPDTDRKVRGRHQPIAIWSFPARASG